MSNNKVSAAFAPALIIGKGVTDISFYEMALGAVELRRWTNDDGSIHVAELSIEGAMFHLHEENTNAGAFSPSSAKGVTTVIGLMVADVDAVMDKAVKAGAKVISPAKSYDYGYRQGDIADIFGHRWTIQMVI
jgi:PhnB protein